MSNKIRESIFSLEIFGPNSGSGYSVNGMILNSSDISLLPQASLINELNNMEKEGLLEKHDEYYRSTILGKIAKQKQLANSGQRNSVLINQKNFAVGDLILAIAASEKISLAFTQSSFDRESFNIYLFEFTVSEIKDAIDEKISERYLELDPFWDRNGLHVTGQGLQHYQQVVRSRLGLSQNEGVLVLSDAELVDERFSLLGVDIELTINMQQRWSEIEVCASVGAYLAAVILLGSVLEGLLLARLQRDIKSAMTSSKAPRSKAAEIKNLNDWSLQDYIAVSVELGFVPRSVEKHIHELRDTRNLVHPNKQISSNIFVDESLFRISKEVAETIIDALLVK